MKTRTLLRLSGSGLRTFLSRGKRPLVASIILTERCNLACRHCAVHDTNGVLYPYMSVQADMQTLLDKGVRILFFYGGEPWLWHDAGKTLSDLVREAKSMGFLLVNVVTNGTIDLDLPEADLILVSVDGTREHHNLIRGSSYDRVLANLRNAPARNICLYMAINKLNQVDLEAVSRLARDLPKVKAVSFNFHTPYPGTEELALSAAEKRDCCDRLTLLLEDGCPILNLRSVFPYLVANNWPRPCRQCIIMENGRSWTCGRCIDIPGLCETCGFFFAAEYSLLFSGRPRIVWDFARSYLRWL